MTYNQIIKLFSNIVGSSKVLKSFGTGELWEIEGNIKPGIQYPTLWAAPIQTNVTDQTMSRTFTFLCFDMVSKDKSNEQEVLSDTEQCLQDFIKILRSASDDYELVGNPTLIPFKEEFSDWATGWRVDFEILTAFNSNDCDVPNDSFISPTPVYSEDGSALGFMNNWQITVSPNEPTSPYFNQLWIEY
jgi:hypothetical protein